MHTGTPLTLLSTVLSITAFVSSISLDCSKIVASDVRWDVSKLSGPRQVHELVRESRRDFVRNTTYTIDLCRPLKKEDPDSCPHDTRICAQQRTYPANMTEPIAEPRADEVFPIAGEGTHSHGRHLDPVPTRLKDSESGADSQKEGLRISFNGGMHEGMEGMGDVKQRAYVELLCDRDWIGTETGKEKEGTNRRLRRREDEEKRDDEDGDEDEGDDDDDDDELPPLENPDKGSALQFQSYNIIMEKEAYVGVLRLEWKTKYACEDAVDSPDDSGTGGQKSGGIGAFGWIVIVIFLAVAAYLIFGSWLNYNRYGARGWDLLPHGDTIRDIPYLLKDWGRRVFGRGGSVGLGNETGVRGGYAAV